MGTVHVQKIIINTRKKFLNFEFISQRRKLLPQGMPPIPKTSQKIDQLASPRRTREVTSDGATLCSKPVRISCWEFGKLILSADYARNPPTVRIRRFWRGSQFLKNRRETMNTNLNFLKIFSLFGKLYGHAFVNPVLNWFCKQVYKPVYGIAADQSTANPNDRVHNYSESNRNNSWNEP